MGCQVHPPTSAPSTSGIQHPWMPMQNIFPPISVTITHQLRRIAASRPFRNGRPSIPTILLYSQIHSQPSCILFHLLAGVFHRFRIRIKSIGLPLIHFLAQYEYVLSYIHSMYKISGIGLKCTRLQFSSLNSVYFREHRVHQLPCDQYWLRWWAERNDTSQYMNDHIIYNDLIVRAKTVASSFCFTRTHGLR